MSIIFTMPGKKGDALLQWPIPYWFHRETQKPITLWLDEQTLAPLKALFEYQPGVEAVELKAGIENWTCGGQPWHFGLSTDDLVGHEVYHLGFRSFPQRQITIEVRQQVPLSLKASIEDLSETPSLICPPLPKSNRCVIHGMGVATHSRETPQLWKFLAGIRGDLESRFDEIALVGSPDDREVGKMAYPDWKDFDDGGDFLKLASFLDASQLVIGAGSCVVVLAGALKVPCIRVHDQIAQIPKVIFNNLGKHQLNATERELRSIWPIFLENLPKAEEIATCP